MADNKNIVAEIVLASLIVGGIVYFFTQCLPKQAAGIFVASDGYNNNNQDYNNPDVSLSFKKFRYFKCHIIYLFNYFN